MKSFYLFSFSIVFLFSCEIKKPSEWYEFCAVEGVKSEWKYGGLLNEKTHIIKTSCGYTIVSNKEVAVGDTIRVKVVSYKRRR